jgi:hypothetical protein
MGRFPRESQDEGGAVFDISISGKIRGGRRALSRGRTIPEQAFPQCWPDLDERSPSPLIRPLIQICCTLSQ